MRLRLTVVDTPGYGDFINNEDGCVLLSTEGARVQG